MDSQQNSSVKNIVQLWQEQGGGVIELPTKTTEQTACQNVRKKRQSRTSPNIGDLIHRSPTPEDEIQTPRAHAVDGAKVHLLDYDRRPRSAPSKRVVSDSHWRKKNSQFKEEPISRSAGRGKVQRKGSAQERNATKNVDTASPDRAVMHNEERQRRRARLNSRHLRDSGHTGITVPGDIVAIRSSRQSLQSSNTSGLFQNGVQEVTEVGSMFGQVRSKIETAQPRPSLEQEVLDPTSPPSIGAPNERLLSGAADPHCRVDRSRLSKRKGRDNVRSDKTNMVSHVLSESKKLFNRPSPEVQFSPSTPSIEAWLENTSDPFIEDGCATMAPTILPLSEPNVTSNDSRKSHDNDHLEKGAVTKTARRGASQRRFSPLEGQSFGAKNNVDHALPVSTSPEGQQAPQIGVENDPNTVPVSLLKRRTARRSASSPVPRRRRKPKDTTDDALGRGAKGELDTPMSKEADYSRTGSADMASHHTVDEIQGSTMSSNISPKHGRQDRRQSLVLDSDQNGRQCTRSPQNLHSRPTIINSLKRRRTTRLTKHSDLMSVLSVSVNGTKGVQPARSMRKSSRASRDTDPELLMNVLKDEETTYVQELRTLVDGVIPVLLSCVLSKADLHSAAGLFGSSEPIASHANFTRPIIDMGVTLERLRSLHRRIPLMNHLAFLTWAHGAQRVYADYLKAWRMGFKDVIINLASAEAPKKGEGEHGNDEAATSNDNGDLVHQNGEKADVAYLLKRPLVRLKHLARTIDTINDLNPSAESQGLAANFTTLVEQARSRVEEERARLEDEAAANVDASRARDPRTLAPLDGVQIEQNLHVRARDFFNLTLRHTNGQSIDCRVELIWRENAHEVSRGDCLFCEVDGTGRWLLFPPFGSDMISARKGNADRAIVVMVQRTEGDGSEWQEVLALESEDEKIADDWLRIFPAEPAPPKLEWQSNSTIHGDGLQSTLLSTVGSLSKNKMSLPENPAELTATPQPDPPIGEKLRYDLGEVSTIEHGQLESELERSNAQHRIPQPDLSKHSAQEGDSEGSALSHRHQLVEETNASLPLTRSPRSFREALGLQGTSSMSGLRRTKANRRLQSDKVLPARLAQPDTSSGSEELHSVRGTGESNVKDVRAHRSRRGLATSGISKSQSLDDQEDLGKHPEQVVSPPPYKESAFSHKKSTGHKEFAEHRTPSTNSDNHPNYDTSVMFTKARRLDAGSEEADHQHSKAERQNSQRSTELTSQSHPWTAEAGDASGNRYLSPLKHQYEPSTATESDLESDLSDPGMNEVSSVTDSSEDSEDEKADVPAPLVVRNDRPLPLRSLPRTCSAPSVETTLQPSDSASQAPYKTVPIQRHEANKTVASILAWSEKGAWEPIHPDECSIVISPGLIEAFEMSAAHSSFPLPNKLTSMLNATVPHDTESSASGQNDEVQGERPLIALELTPLVPLRKGTAIDISIRSPPTSNSQITSGNNILFRSRSPEECEALYMLINHARIHNPTYIALQNARGPFGGDTAFSPSNTRTSAMGPGSARHSWFGGFGRSSSYRSRTKRASSVTPSDSSVGTMASAFSALRRFGRGNQGKFDIALSTITSRHGGDSDPGSVYSTSDNASRSGTGKPVAGMTANRDGSLGLTDAKVRIYCRETSSKWRDMGSARLTILQPEKDNSVAPSSHYNGLHSKRILVHGKTKGEVLLDAQLGESCFERVARTGIAVSVWEDVVGPNGEVGVVGAVGGVVGGTTKVYMIQMKSEAETAYTFSLVGKLRY